MERGGQRTVCTGVLECATAQDDELPTAQAYFDRGDSRHARGDYAGAIADYTRAIALAPSNAAPWCNRGNAKFAKAETKCRPLIASATPQVSAAQRAQLQQEFAKFTTCMKLQGVTVRTPRFGGFGPSGRRGQMHGHPVDVQ